MAIFHASVKVFSRSSGHSSVAAAAYRAGSKLLDLRRGTTHDYSRKRDVDDALIILPKEAPSWASIRESLWNAVEFAEKRKDAQLCREVEVALPIELDKKAQRKLVASYVRDNFVDQGMTADIAFHGLDTHNPHAHILLTLRRFENGELANKERAWNDRGLLLNWRKNWEVMANRALAEAGSSERIDSRSYAQQGLETLPTKHLGKAASAMERRSIPTELGDRNRAINKVNRALTNLNRKISKLMKFRRLIFPTSTFNKWAERMHEMMRLKRRLLNDNLSEWLGAGYWLHRKNALKKERKGNPKVGNTPKAGKKR